MDILHELYETVEGRRQEKQEGSYTCYLFEKGLDPAALAQVICQAMEERKTRRAVAEEVLREYG